MKKLLAVALVLVAQQLMASQTVVEDGCTTGTDCPKVQKYAQVCVVNPQENNRDVLVRTSWNIGDGKHPLVLTSGAQVVYRLAMEEPKADAQLSVSFRKSCLVCGVRTKQLAVSWTQEATNDCDKLPKFEFVYTLSGNGKPELDLVPAK